MRVELPSGATATVSADVSGETLTALDRMAVLAVEQVMRGRLEADPEAEGEGLRLSEDELRGVRPGFRVHDDDSAEWVVGKVLEARRRQKEIKARAERMIEAARHEEEFFLARFGEDLEAYARVQVARYGGRRKSHPLLSGLIGFVTKRPSFAVADEALLLAFAEEKVPGAVRVVPERRTVEKGEVNRAIGGFDEDGLVLAASGEVCTMEGAGLSYVRGGESFQVTEARK